MYTRQLEADDIAASVNDSVLRVAGSLDEAQENLQAAFGRDGGAVAFSATIRTLSDSIKKFQEDAAKASQEGRPEEAKAIQDRVSLLRQEAQETLLATSAIRRFAESLDAASQEAQRNLSSASQASDEARRNRLGFDTASARAAEQLSLNDLSLQRSLSADVAAAIASSLERAAESIASGDPASRELAQTVGRIQEINNQLATAGVLPAGAREQLVSERARLEQQALELDPAVAAARDASTREEERRQSALRGRQGLLSQGERAGEELVGQIRDLRQATRSDVAAAVRDGRFGEIDQIQARGREAEARLLSEQSRQVAPAIFSFADSVQNAVLQGPSRAALNVSDISTQEGARELNRLLRGDDPARDNTNLVELQRQSQLLEDNNRILREKLQTA